MSDLDDMFAQARRTGPEPSPGLTARVMADALAVQSEQLRRASAPPAPRTFGFVASLIGLFGGAGPLAGGLVAGIAGIAIGYLQPESLSGLTAIIASGTSAEQMELIPGFDTLLSEE